MGKSGKCNALLLVFVALTPVLAAQQLPIANPEDLAGRWETSDGHGGMVGMNVVVSTDVVGRPVSLAGQKQYLDELEIGIFRRAELDTGTLEFNFFSTSSKGGATWDGKELRLLAAHSTDLPKVDVRLSWDGRKKQWHGRYERGTFSGEVTLKRPEMAKMIAFAGTWFHGAGPVSQCLHIAQQSDGQLTAWSGSIAVPGRMRWAIGIQPPSQTTEHFGEIEKAEMVSPGLVTVDTQPYGGWCCPHPLTVRISHDGKTMLDSEAPRRVWRRIPRGSCVSSASDAASHGSVVGVLPKG